MTVPTALGAAQWQFARTMASTPHEWTRRNRWDDSALFTECVRVIQDKEMQTMGSFIGRPTAYYIPGDGYQYWTMGSSPDDTIIINRSTVGSSA